MKAVGGLFDRIWERSNLAAAAWRAAQGKGARPEAWRFIDNLDEELREMGTELREERYRFSEYRAFSIRDPKSRVIHAPSFRDRVTHHAIIAVTGPVFERGALAESYACRLGRGQHAALRQARRWTRWGDWHGKVDVARYYDSMEHERLRRALRRRFREERLLGLFDGLLESYEAGPGRGLPIGALTSQYLGNFFLDRFDRRMKETGLARRYLRYMDDSVMWGTREEIVVLRERVVEALGELGLEMKSGGEWNHCDRGLPFLGFVVYPNRLRLGARGRRRLRRKVRELEREWKQGSIAESELQDRGEALFAYAQVGDDVAWRRMVAGFSRMSDIPSVARAQEQCSAGGRRIPDRTDQ